MENKLTTNAALRHAGICTNFMWEDKADEGLMDGYAEVDSARIIGMLPEEINGSPVYIIHVDGTATSEFGYDYPVEEDVKVSLQENGEPIMAIATEEDIEAAKQHRRDEACKEYADLSHIIEVGAYVEDRQGNYWYPDENGQNISARIAWLEGCALEEGLSFAKQGDGSYKLEPASAEEIKAYQKAKEEAEEAEEGEE